MSDQLLRLVNDQQFTKLFTEHLGWGLPTQPTIKAKIDDETTLDVTNVADYRGLRVWHCPTVPDRAGQLAVDRVIAKGSNERLLIFTDSTEQEWRWPRYRAQRGTSNPRLVNHSHTVGEANPNLLERLDKITITPGTSPTVPELITRLRDAFDQEAETASVRAARVMGLLYEKLDEAGLSDDDTSLLLARVLFLMFGDDTDMWDRDLFLNYLLDHTEPDGTDLHIALNDIFVAADNPRESRPDIIALGRLPYINGGIFSATITLPPLPQSFREALIEACTFDWGQISPAVFGSMFQTVKSTKERRELGEHYTTEANILKTIEPLFLNELREELDAAWNSKTQLTKLRNRLKDYRYLDPACGCGNFLIVAYRELRNLELEILKRRRDLDEAEGIQLSLDATDNLNVTIDQFYGIEIEPWPARIAETAMFLIDHLTNQAMETELGQAPKRLPIPKTATIVTGNALRLDWNEILPASDSVRIFGNPPYAGHKTRARSETGKAQTKDLQQVWKSKSLGRLDLVTAWFAKTLDYFGGETRGRWAYVATSSLCQGEPVPALWRPILDAKWRCRFAHRSLIWDSEAADSAAVHVSIVGFDRHEDGGDAALWTYPEGGKGIGSLHRVGNINPYLVAAEDIFVDQTRIPLADLPKVFFGNMPRAADLMIEIDAIDEFRRDPIASRYVHRFVGSEELLHNNQRWCLWIEDADVKHAEQSPLVRKRLDGVAAQRRTSSAESTRQMALTPHLFGQRSQPQTNYLAIPAHVSEHRLFFVAAYYSPEVICGNANFLSPDPDGFLLGVLSSTQFITWMKTVGGRLESRIRFSNTLTYNTFPLPPLDKTSRVELIEAAQEIVRARENHADLSLAEMYDPKGMPEDLLEAHASLDRVVDPLFGLQPEATLAERQSALFASYSRLTKED